MTGLLQSGNGLFFKLEIQGEKQVVAGLSGLLKRINDFRPIAEPIDWVLRKSVSKMFEGEGRPRYPWPQLARATQLDRIRHGYGGEHPILVRTEQLKRSFINKQDAGHILDKHLKYFDFGSRTPYAIYHQTGGSKIPRRPMIFIDSGDVNQIVRILRMYIADNKVFKQSGGV